MKDDANRAVADRKWKKALEAYWQLEKAESQNGLWAQKAGEMQRKLDRFPDAIASFTRAADAYAKSGFLVKAIAVCKLILEIDPGHTATQAKLATLGAKQRSGEFAGSSTSLTARPSTITPSPFGPESTSTAARPGTAAGSRPGPLVPEPTGIGARPTGLNRVPTGLATPPTGFTPKAAGMSPPHGSPAAAPPLTGRLPGLPRPNTPPPSLLDDPPFMKPVAAPAPIPVRPPAPMPVELDVEIDPPEPEPLMFRRPPTPMASDSLAVLVPDAHPAPLDLEVEAGDDDAIEVLEIPLEEVDTGAVEEDEFASYELTVGGAEEMAAAPSSAVVAAESVLPKTALFGALEPPHLQRLIQVVRLVRLAAGDILFRRGDVGDALFVVSEGEVDILANDDEASLKTLTEGAFFGEIALLADQPRMATVRARTDARLLAIDRAMVQELIDASPEIPKILLRFVRDRLVETLVAENPLFQPFSPDDRTQLAGRFRFLELEANQKILEEGKRAAGLFVLLTGRATSTQEGRPFLDLGPGDIAGEMSVLSQGPAVATVETQTRCLALELPRAEFTEVMMTHPQILEFVSELADGRKKLLESWQRGEIEYPQKRVGLV